MSWVLIIIWKLRRTELRAARSPMFRVTSLNSHANRRRRRRERPPRRCPLHYRLYPWTGKMTQAAIHRQSLS